MRADLLRSVLLARHYRAVKIPSQNSYALAKERYRKSALSALIAGKCAQVAACRRHDCKYVTIV